MDVFAANDLAAFNSIAGTPTETATAGRFDATYCTQAIAPGTSGLVRSPQFINPTTGAALSLTDAWVHASLFTGNQSGTYSAIELVNTAGTPVVRLAFAGAGILRIDYWSGAAWVAGASTFTAGTNLLKDIDMHIVCGLTGSIDLYVNNSLVLSTSGLNAAVTNLAFVNLTTSATSGPNNFSQILVSDTNTIGVKVGSLTPNANGANTAWANDYLNLVKTGFNDATLVSSTTLNDKESYATTDVTLPTAQYFVSSVWMAVRGRLNSAAPQNVKPLARIGGTDYSGAYNFTGSINSVSFAPGIAAFPLDPSTGLAWAGVTNINAAEFGFITQT